MNTTNSLSLIKGEFTAPEAKHVLTKLFKHKINFHQARILEHFEKYGEENTGSYKRIEELRQTRDEMIDIIDRAEENGFDIQLTSNVLIEFIEKKNPHTKEEELFDIA